jgi:hypothetical protein
MDKILSALLLAAAASAAQGQVYRWTDDRGIVNYSNKPPPAGVPSVTVAEPEPPLASAPEPQRSPTANSELRERVDTLERELAVERSARQLTAQADDDRRRRAKEECERQRRVDCDELDTLQENGPVIVRPRVRPRPVIVPTLPVPATEPKRPPSAPPKTQNAPASSRMGPGTRGL